MQINLTNLPNSEVKFEITLSESQMAELFKKAINDLKKNVKVAGFRPGKAPDDVVEAQIGRDKILGYIIENNLSKFYADAVKEKGITPISRPTVEITAEDPLSFTATCAVQPEVKLDGLDKIKIKAPKTEVSKKEIDEALERIKKSNSTFKEVDRKTKDGDRIELNFEGFDADGNEIPGTKSQNHPLTIGDKMFIPGFEENLVGLAKEEEKEFTVTFPENYHVDELKSKPVTFKVKVTRIEEVVLPEITEEMAEKVFGEKMDKEAFLAKLKDELEHAKIHENEAKQEDELFESLLKASDFAVSEILIEEEVEILLDEMKKNIESQGLKFEEFIKLTEAREKKSIQEVYKTKAEERVKIRFIIDYVIKERKLEASAEEMAEKAESAVEKAPEAVRDQVKSYYQEGNPGYNALRNQILLDKFFAEFIEKIPHGHHKH